MATDFTALPLETVTPARLARRAARRLSAVAWFIANSIAVGVIVGLGAVVALGAVTVACLAAPLLLVVLYAAMRAHDARMARAATS